MNFKALGALSFMLAFGGFMSYQVGLSAGFQRGLLALGFAIPTAITFTLLGIAFERDVGTSK